MRKILMCLLMFMLSLNVVAAEDNVYNVAVVFNDSYKVIESSDDIEYINEFYDKNTENYDNLLIMRDNEVLRMEYGIVSFHRSEGCDYNVEYLNVNYRSSGYLNACYGSDAAYIKTNDDLDTIDFEVSGTYGRVKISDADLIPLESVANISNYQLVGDEFFHFIAENPLSDNYISMINLGDAPDYIKEGTEYYSYDGHYFYTDKKQMLRDYVDLHYYNSVNQDNPYYNYYMYLSHRSYSNYDIDELNDYIDSFLMIDSSLTLFDSNYHSSVSDIINQSQYHGNIEPFFQYQYQYGANAMMMLSLSMNETATGRSSLSFRRNNLFGHAAYDSDVEAKAKRYLSVANSIEAHAKTYISKTYMNNERFQYKGGFFGNKDSGMNVLYASDPYWGEKAASYFYQLDKVLGFKDHNQYCIGISNDFDKVEIYDDNFEMIYRNTLNNMAFILVEEVDEYYKIQYETSYDDQEYSYDFELNTAYVSKEDIDYILNEDKLNKTVNYHEVEFNADGGVFNDGNIIINYKLPENHTAVTSDPFRKGYLFSEYNYFNVAVYEKIKSLRLTGDYRTEYNLNEFIDLSDMILQIETTEKTYDIPVNSSMINKVLLTEAGEQEITINYQNNIIKFKLNVSETESDHAYREFEEEIQKFTGLGELSDNDLTDLLVLIARIKESSYNGFSNEELISLDSLLYAYDNRTNYQIAENSLDLGISGLNIATFAEKTLPLINDNLLVTVENVNDEKLNKIVVNNGYDSYNQFTLDFLRNNETVECTNEVLISVDKPGLDDKDYFVFEKADGKIIRLKTYQSDDKLFFRTMGKGTYLIGSNEPLYELSSVAYAEVLTFANSEENSYNGLFNALYITAGVLSVLLLIMFYIKRKSS